MPQRTSRICAHRGCNAITRNPRFCDSHAQDAERERKRQVDQRRSNSASRGYGHKWRMARARFLQLHPLCADCAKAGITTAAQVVDHIEPHKGDQYLFWNEANWQPLCQSCHSRKTAREDGGYGNRRAMG